MAEQHRLLSLVPVGLREAVIDSPPFRASIRHFEDQVEALEKWLEGYIKILSDWLSGLQRLEENTTVLYGRAAPGFLAEGLIDPDYTFLAMTRFAEGLKQFWGKIFGMGREIREIMITPTTKFLREDIKEFKGQKREFGRIQDRYEELVARYASQSKTKEPSALREEAYQLYSVRMSYIQAAASYSIAISNFRTACDRVLVSAFAGFSDRELRLQGEIRKDFSGLGKEMKKILAWNDEMTKSAKTLQDRLNLTKAKLEKEVAEMVQPKRDLAIYQTYTLPAQGKALTSRLARSSVGSDSSTGSQKRSFSVSVSGKPAKQGWLFNRITTGKPARNTWVRRWFFVKDGTFGWLNISSKTAAVEESDRVGVLLCNVRLMPSEERRFCFEVMTKSMHFMLQAETENELADWVQVFQLAKNAILADERQHPQAFSITAPSHAEFAAPQADEHDRLAPPGLSTPQGSSTPRGSFDVNPPTGGGGSMQASRSIVHKLESRLKDRPKGGPGPSGGIASLVAASQSALAGQHVPVQPISISAPRPVDVFANPVGGSNIAPGTLAHPPLSTQMSTRAVQARSRTASSAATNTPSGVMANYWGSMHWGLVSVEEVNEITDGADSTNRAQSSADSFFERSQKGSISIPNSPVSGNGKELSRRSSVSHNRSHSNSVSSVDFAPIQYPSDYPVELRKQDSQFRTLFPACRPDEFVLLVCRVMWQPIEGQQLWGRMYATTSGLHFFAHAQGMVCVQSVPFSDIIKISHHVGVSADNIVIERDNMNPVDAKVYLDSANLLTRRIDVLFRNSLSDQPMDTQELLQQIRQMEEERDSDQEVTDTDYVPLEEDFEVIRSPNATGGSDADEAARSGLNSQTPRKTDDSVRVVFPSEPVICNCKDHLEKRFSEYIFHIPAKSLFHLMFGDNTPIWKKVYRSRKVADLEIGPWKAAGNQLVREYKYVVDFTDAVARKQRETSVTEYQTILKRDEFLCYVILVKYRPWDLPRNESIALLHKYCITYISKTKCKLLVSTGVDLISVPKLVRAFVKRAAHNSIEDTASKVISEVESQVNILGKGSDVQRAIKMYGRIGGTLDGQKTKTGFVVDPAQTYKDRSMISLFMEDMLGTTEEMIEDLFNLPSSTIRGFFGFLSSHRILIGMLVFSVFMNFFLSGRSTVGYWQHRKADKIMLKAGVKSNNAMVRMVALKDIDDLVSGGLTGVNTTHHGLCYDKFAELFALNDLADPNYDTSPEFMAITSRQKASKLRSARQDLNVIRHNLLVSLRTVNNVEKELVDGEWMIWLSDELYQCDGVAQLLATASEEDLEKRAADIAKFKDYCGDCDRVWGNVRERFMALS